jgi:hypothetical protein
MAQLKTYNGEKTVSSTNVAGKTGYLHAENETKSMFLTQLKPTQSGSRTLI